MSTGQNLTPAAKTLLAEAEANGGLAYNVTNGPMTQLVEAGLATTFEHPWKKGTRTGIKLVKPHTQNGEWCECPACADPLSR